MGQYYSDQAQANMGQYQSQGNGMQQQFQNQEGYAANLYNQYGGQTQAYQQSGNNPNLGYTQQQQANQLGGSWSTGLNGVSPMTTSQLGQYQQGANDVYSQAQQGGQQTAQNVQANNNQLGAYMAANYGDVTGTGQQYAQGITGAANTGATSIAGAVNPNAFGLSQAYQNDIANSLGGEQAGLNTATSNPNLGLTSQFLNNYQFTPQEQQAVITSAGNAVGAQYGAAEDQLQRQAAMSGNSSPLAIAAANQGLLNTEAGQASAAMTAASLGATQTSLATQQNLQQMQLGSAQDISSRQMQSAEALAGSQLGAYNTEAGLQLQGTTAGQGLNLQAQQAAANLGVGGQEAAGNLAEGAEQYGAGLESGDTEFATGENLQAGEAANQLALQGGEYAGQYGLGAQAQQYGQGMGVYGALSGNYANINQAALGANEANQSLNAQQQAAALGYLGTTQGQQVGVYGTEGQLANTAQYNAYGEQNPSIWQQAGAAAEGLASAFGI